MNYSENEIEVLESSLEHWILSDKSNAVETLGEDVVWAAEMELGHDRL